MKIKRQHIIGTLSFIVLCILAFYALSAKRSDIEISQMTMDAFCGASFQISNTTRSNLKTDLLIKTYDPPSSGDPGGLSWSKSVSYTLQPYEERKVNEKMDCVPGHLPTIVDVEVVRTAQVK